MMKFLKKPYIAAIVIALAVGAPVLASGIMQKQQPVSMGATDNSSRVTAVPIANPIKNTPVPTALQTAQNRVSMTPLDKTLDEVQAEAAKQQAAASAKPGPVQSGSNQPVSTQTASSTQPAASMQQQGNPLNNSSFALLKKQGLTEGQIKKINQIIASGISQDQLAALLNDRGYGSLASALAHKRNEVRKTEHHEAKHQKHNKGKGHKGDD